VTNTLHRHTTKERLKKDYIVFAIPSRGYNDAGSVPKLQDFLRRAVHYGPVNLGDAAHGALLRPSKGLTPLAHWVRSEPLRHREVIAGVDTPTTAAAVFDNEAAAVDFMRALRQADLGLSINLSAPVEEAHRCCRKAGIVRHSVEYSLRAMGKTDLLPEGRVLELATMCGHGMISFDFTRKMLDWVREGRRNPKQASEYLARFCTCGIFNPARAVEILEEARASPHPTHSNA